MTDSSNSFMARLKAATDDLHSYAERRPLQRSMLKGDLPAPLYAAYLGQLLCVHHALEAALLELQGSQRAIAAVFAAHQRRENELREDLAHFSVDPDTVTALPPTEHLIQQIKRTAADEPVGLLGMLYVLEGSTNGSKFIAKAMMRAQGMSPGPGLMYLDPYGEQQTERWRQFKQSMDEIQWTSEDESSIVAAARCMFQAVADISDEVNEPVAA